IDHASSENTDCIMLMTKSYAVRSVFQDLTGPKNGIVLYVIIDARQENDVRRGDCPVIESKRILHVTQCPGAERVRKFLRHISDRMSNDDESRCHQGECKDTAVSSFQSAA
uniref:hypothetical protein n=1 Tax=Acetobacter nitrogenifigens TaxID=285268 RepID=UPI001B7FC049